MLDRDYCILMAEYNAFMNAKVYEACAALSDEERKRDRKAFFKSLHGTLNHLVWADRAFLARLFGQPLPAGGPGDLVHEDFGALRREREALDAAFLEWARNLPEGLLSEPYEMRSIAYQRRRRMPRYLMVVQMWNHQTHHRGQITTLLSQLGIDIGTTDLPFMPFADSLCVDLPL